MVLSPLHLTFTLDPGTNAAAVAQLLEAEGLQVDEVLDAIGVVLGRAHPSVQARLAKVAGVADVEVTVGFEVGPPDAALS